MTYIGQQPSTTFDSGIQDRFTGLTTNTVTLTHDISAETDILVVWNNIVQDSGTYSVGGTGNKTLTLGGTLVSADVVTVYYLNKVMQSVNPTAGSVNTTQLADLGVTGAKLNTDVISAQTALGATPADTDELLVSDAGVLKRVDYSYLKSATIYRETLTPLIVNGDMAVSQRSTSVTGIGNGDSGYHTVDRFRYQEGATPGAVWTMAQDEIDSTDGGNAWAVGGHTRALKMSCTTADSSLDSGIVETIDTYLEKQNLKAFRKGSSGAKPFTLAFWIKSTKTGTNICELQDQSNDRAVSVAYTISSSNTWEHKVLNFPADTTGAWTPNNQLGLKIRWYLTAGSEYQASSLQTAWAASATGKRANGQVNNADSTSNVWNLTGVQLEVGEFSSTTLPPFQHESYGDNLHRCARYFWYTGNGSVWQHHGTGVEASSVAAYINIPLINSLRTGPTITCESIGSLVVWDGDGESTITSLGNTYYSSYGSMVNQAVTCSGGGIANSAGVTVYSSNDATSGFYIDAELA